MKLKLATASLGLALAAGAVAPATAADWNNGAGGIKDYRTSAAVPVPAPIPVYEAPTRWYFRADIGLGMGADPHINHGGMPLGSPAGTPLDAPSSWFHPDFNTFVNWGLGVGYIINPSWRVDLTWDIRSQGTVTANANYAYEDAVNGGGLGTLYDRTLFRSNVVLFNAYYDFQRMGAVVPYIGAGLGFSVNEIERTSRIEQGGGTPLSVSAYNRNHDVSIAAAAMAGFAYNMNESVALDFGYRYMYIGGSESALTIRGNASHLSVGDIHEHQLRAGARINVY